MKLWFTPDFHAKRADELAGYKTMLVDAPIRRGLRRHCAAIRDADFTTVAPTISVPVLAVVDTDGSTLPDLVRSTAALIPDAQFEIIEAAAIFPASKRWRRSPN